MLISCPSCGGELDLPASAAGKQGRCPKCQQTFPIPRLTGEPAEPNYPNPTAPPLPPQMPGGLGAAPPVVDVERAKRPIPPPLPGARSPVWSLLAIGGAVLMVIAFFVPWWGLSVTLPVVNADAPQTTQQMYKKELRRAYELTAADSSFYLKRHKLTEALNSLDPEHALSPTAGLKPIVREASAMLFGWDSATGVLTLIFGIIIMALVVVPLVVPALKRWDGVFCLPAAGLAIPVVILALVFWLATPGDDTATILSQGVLVGPFVSLGGSLLAAVGTVVIVVRAVVPLVRSLVPKAA